MPIISRISLTYDDGPRFTTEEMPVGTYTVRVVQNEGFIVVANSYSATIGVTECQTAEVNF